MLNLMDAIFVQILAIKNSLFKIYIHKIVFKKITHLIKVWQKYIY
ncbi:MAG: hypothetical protein RLZZ236_1456 [Bacteroidota bacterium]|jgi:hypothetical protein